MRHAACSSNGVKPYRRLLYVLVITFLISADPNVSSAQIHAPLRRVATRVSAGLNKGFLFLQDHRYFLSVETKIVRPWFEGMGDGSGLGGGLKVIRQLPFDMEGMVGGTISMNRYRRVVFSLTKDVGPVRTGPTGRYAVLPEEDFFGEGQNTVDENRSTFQLKDRNLGWSTDAKLGSSVRLRHAVRWRQYDVSAGRDTRFATTQAIFSPAEVSGGFEPGRFVTNEIGATLEARDDVHDPRSGYGADAVLTRGNAIGKRTDDFTTLRAVATTYVPLSSEKAQVLAFRGEVVRNMAADVLPFYLQPTLGGSGTLRGFREYRFRDRDALALSAEYRYRVWRHLDAVIFGDFGQVYSNIARQVDELSLESAGGMGLRLNMPEGLRLRLSVGHSGEGTRLFFKIGSSSW
jgi:hypothetical protein